MSGEVPEGWTRTTLAALADITRGVSWRDENETSEATAGALPVLGIRNVQQSLKLDETVWLAGLSQKAIASSTVRSGDILMVGSNGNPARIGNAVRIDVPGVYLYASLLFGVRPDEKHVDGEFLFHLIRSSAVQQAISDTVQGSTGLANLKITVLRDIPILLPEIDEQRRIAGVLRSVDEATEAHEKVCRQFSAVFAGTLEACFTAAEWPSHRLGDLCESIQVGIVVKPASYYVDSGGVPALRSLNVLENRLSLDDLVYISESGHEVNQKSSLRAGDVVTRRTGEPGKTAMIPSGFESGLNCIDIIFSRPKDCLRSAYLSFFMNSEAAKRQVAGLQGGLAQQHLNVGEMKKLVLPLPDLQTQDQTVEILNDIWVSMEAARHALLKLATLKANLASDLLCGRIRVPA